MPLSRREGDVLVLALAGRRWVDVGAVEAVGSQMFGSAVFLLRMDFGEKQRNLQDVVARRRTSRLDLDDNLIRRPVVVVREQQWAEVNVVGLACRSVDLYRAYDSISVLGCKVRVWNFLVCILYHMASITPEVLREACHLRYQLVPSGISSGQYHSLVSGEVALLTLLSHKSIYLCASTRHDGTFRDSINSIL